MSMTDNDYKHFVCIVAGDNPTELIEEYNKNKDIKPKIVYRYKDIPKIRQAYINEYKNALNDAIENNANYIETIKETIELLVDTTDEEYYDDILYSNHYYYADKETGDIMTNKNIDGKYSYCNIGKIFSIPFLTKSGVEVFQSKKNDIDWNVVHLSGGHIYGRVWEMVMENSKPNDEHEEILYNNMKDKIEYFKKFETKENYIISNTAFWGYAFLSEKTGWVEINDTDDQFEWMKNFYDIFIKNLSDDTLLTIYECRK